MEDKLKDKQIQIIKQLNIWFIEKRVGRHKLIYSNKINDDFQIFYNEYSNYNKKQIRYFKDFENLPKKWRDDFIELIDMYNKSLIVDI